MIVDAEEPIRELARTVLEQNGYRVVVAVDGRQAVEALCREESKAALVLLDVHAAPSSGGDTLDELWALDREVRVLLMNSQLPAATFEKGAKNVHGFLVKPFRPADLLAAVRAALETSRHEGGADAREQGAPASGAEEVAPQVPR